MMALILSKVVLVTLVLAAASPAVAQDAPADWAGTYRGVRQNQLPKGLTVIGAELDAFVPPHLQPWALDKQKATDLEEGDTGIICKLTGPFRQFTGGGSL